MSTAHGKEANVRSTDMDSTIDWSFNSSGALCAESFSVGRSQLNLGRVLEIGVLITGNDLNSQAHTDLFQYVKASSPQSG